MQPRLAAARGLGKQRMGSAAPQMQEDADSKDNNVRLASPLSAPSDPDDRATQRAAKQRLELGVVATFAVFLLLSFAGVIDLTPADQIGTVVK